MHKESPHEVPDGRLVEWVRDALSAENFLRKVSEHLNAHHVVGADAEASMLIQRVQYCSETHVEALEETLADFDREASSVRRAVSAGLGTALGWMERLPSRDLVQAVRDVYTALHFTTGGYHVLYTRAVLLEDEEAGKVRDLALRHLETYAPIVRQSSRLIVWAAAFDLPLDKWYGQDVLGDVLSALTDTWRSEAAVAPELDET